MKQLFIDGVRNDARRVGADSPAFGDILRQRAAWRSEQRGAPRRPILRLLAEQRVISSGATRNAVKLPAQKRRRVQSHYHRSRVWAKRSHQTLRVIFRTFDHMQS